MKKLKLVEGGLADFQGAVDALKDFGRYEDDTLAHVATGETIVPMEVFEKNPKLRDQVFKSMADLGIDPTQYIVGSDFNSINPVTGQPEFFLKKLFKKLKKAAPILLPIAASFIPGAGPLTMAAAGFGGGKMAGQDTKQALMSGVLAGLGGKMLGGTQAANLGGYGSAANPSLGSSLFKGLTSDAGGISSLFQPAASEIYSSGANASELAKNLGKRAQGGGDSFSKMVNLFRKGGEEGAKFSPYRIMAAGALANSIPSLFGGEEEEEYVDTNVYPGDYGQLLELAKARTYNPGSNIIPFQLAQGGIVNLKEGGFPYATAKRAEGGVTGPGTGTSDDIPAYLSNGEFVVTAKAVKNAGGSQPMYDMMDHLEKGGKLSKESRGI
tara:strand:+ start:422 stop:1567 length:1146 start_codon:yes stop_codon:yes gene_type:complete